MRPREAVHASCPLVLLACQGPGRVPETPPPLPPSATAGMVAADHPLASEAGAEMLRRGGNAVDAAVAAALAGGVVQPQSSGLGGGGFAVVVMPGKEPISLDFREVAPSTASADMFLDAKGRPIPEASGTGLGAVAIPGEPGGLSLLLRRFGTLPPEIVASPAIRYAREGFPVGVTLAEDAAWWSGRHGNAIFPLLFDASTSPPTQGTMVTRSRLAATLDDWAAGETLASGLLPAADVAAYEVVERKPLTGPYRDWTLVTMPPPSSGGLVILQTLQVLEVWPPVRDPLDPVVVHRTTQALQHAFADRARWMADPAFVDVPVDRLLGPERIAAVRASLQSTGEPPRCSTLKRDAYGLPLDAPNDAGTHHISVLDANGVAVALTTTINTLFGSGVVDPTTGVLYNDEMDDFVVAPGVPNAFGLVGNERNAIAPGKRPLSSMSPTVALDAAGHPLVVIGASGGPRIITGTLEMLRAVKEAGLDASAAQALPRYHHQWLPPVLFVERDFPGDVARSLRGCGYAIERTGPENAVQVVLRRPDGSFDGASDPRKGGLAVQVRPTDPFVR